MEPLLCMVSSWVIRVYTILVWSTISGSSNLNICFYHCLILTLILHLKVLFITTTTINIIISISISISISTTTTTTTTTTIIVVVIVLLFIIYIVHLFVVRPQSCWVIYYFDTPALERRHQSFSRVILHLIT